MNSQTDVLIIGSGTAGLFYALKVADSKKVTLLAKSQLTDSNSHMAQGGVAAVLSQSDSFEQHVQDTLKAGAYLGNEEVVQKAIEDSPLRIQDLMDWGVSFDIKENKLDLTREGGHEKRRIVHVQDYTGRAIQEVLIQRVKEHKNITVLENCMAIDLLVTRKLRPSSIEHNRCFGAYVFDHKKNEIGSITAPLTVLATGGAGKIYLYTSNWSGATGDGIAMAARAGARIANLEFMQFHPTCLYHPQARNFLISEALRGEGGELINRDGLAFMRDVHPQGSLAPRDIVARSIDAEMKRTGAESVFLDMTSLSRDYLKERFPLIFEKCLSYGIDMSKEPIPVVPAAHYLCGGVLTNLYGQTDLDGLLAVGETACNGFHGANRLASNSLLDCTVFSQKAADWTLENWGQLPNEEKHPTSWRRHDKKDQDEMVVIHHMWDEIRRLMWNYVGIVRSTKRLERAQHRLDTLAQEIHSYYWNFELHPDILELRNLALVAQLTVQSALKRKNSIGIHYSIDAPEADASNIEKKTTIIDKSSL